jgi:hypothetical protein
MHLCINLRKNTFKKSVSLSYNIWFSAWAASQSTASSIQQPNGLGVETTGQMYSFCHDALILLAPE